MRCKLYSLLLPAYTILGDEERQKSLIGTIVSFLSLIRAEQSLALLLLTLYGCTDSSIYYYRAHELIDPWSRESSPKKSKLSLIRRLADYDRWLKHNSLPSGIRLVALLNEHLNEIMERERMNHTSIHLYCTGPYWVAFERSAYQLHRAFPDSETTPLRLFAYPFPIVMVSVTDRSLRSYARKHILRWDETDYVVLTAPESSSTDYRRWHAGEVEGLPQLT